MGVDVNDCDCDCVGVRVDEGVGVALIRVRREEGGEIRVHGSGWGGG